MHQTPLMHENFLSYQCVMDMSYELSDVDVMMNQIHLFSQNVLQVVLWSVNILMKAQTQDDHLSTKQELMECPRYLEAL